jgi:hypothetical protein
MNEANLVVEIRALEELMHHRGWVVLRERCEAETQFLVDQITSPRAKSDNAFERGCIWAATQLVRMPQRLLDELKMVHLAQQSKDVDIG